MRPGLFLFAWVMIAGVTVSLVVHRLWFAIYTQLHGQEISRRALGIHLVLMLIGPLGLAGIVASESNSVGTFISLVSAVAWMAGTTWFFGMFKDYDGGEDRSMVGQSEGIDGTTFHHRSRRAWWMQVGTLLIPTGLALFLAMLGLAWRDTRRTIVLRQNQLALIHNNNRLVIPLDNLFIGEDMLWDGTPVLSIPLRDKTVAWPVGGIPVAERKRLISIIRKAAKDAEPMQTKQAKEQLAHLRQTQP